MKRVASYALLIIVEPIFIAPLMIFDLAKQVEGILLLIISIVALIGFDLFRKDCFERLSEKDYQNICNYIEILENICYIISFLGILILLNFSLLP